MVEDHTVQNDRWERKGLRSLTNQSFEQLKDTFDLINKDFWLSLQIRSQLTAFLGERIQLPEISNVEKHLRSRIYKMIANWGNAACAALEMIWENDLI